MRRSVWMHRLTSLFVGAVLVSTAAATALADAGDRAEQQAEQFEERLDEFEDAEHAEVASEDIEQARQWLDDARVLIAEDEASSADRLLRRVKLSLDLIGALLEAEKIEQVADDQEAVYYRAKDEQLPEFEEEIEELEDQKDELEDQKSELEEELSELR